MIKSNSNVALIFDAKKEPLNYSWVHYCEHPEMKKYLKNIQTEGGMYRLVDERTGNIVMQGSMSLERYLK